MKNRIFYTIDICPFTGALDVAITERNTFKYSNKEYVKQSEYSELLGGKEDDIDYYFYTGVRNMKTNRFYRTFFKEDF